MQHELKTMRVYEISPDVKGYRVLVDRLWPRGLRKELLEPFIWAKEVTPSTDLRKWFGHKPERFQEFSERYKAELDSRPEADAFRAKVDDLLQDKDVLLLYAAKSKEINHANVLKEWLTH